MLPRFTATFGAQLVLAITSALIQIYWARHVAAEQIGIYYKFAIANDIVLVATTLSIDQAIVRAGFTENRYRAALCILYLSLLIAVGLGTGVVIALQLIDASVRGSEVVGITTVLSGALLTLANYASVKRFAAGNIDRIVFWRAIAFAAGCAVSAGAISWWSASALEMAYRDLIFSASCLGIFLVLDRPSLSPRWDVPEIKNLLSFSFRLWLVNVTSRVAMRADYLVFARFSSTEAFGMYAQLRALAEGFLGMLTYQIQTHLFVHFVREHREAKSAQGKLIAPLWLAGALLVTIIFIAILSEPLARLILPTILGPGWTNGAILVPGIILLSAGVLCLELSVSYLKAKARHIIMVVPYLLRAGVLVILLLVPVANLSPGQLSWIFGLSTVFAALVFPAVLSVRASQRRREL